MEPVFQTEERQNYSLKEVLEISIKVLSGITIPISVFGLPGDQVKAIKNNVSDPVSMVKNNLIECVRAIERDEQAELAKLDKQDDLIPEAIIEEINPNNDDACDPQEEQVNGEVD